MDKTETKTDTKTDLDIKAEEKKTEKGKDVQFISVAGVLDLHTIEEFDNRLKSMLKGGNYNVVLDLSKVNFISSIALGPMITTLARNRMCGGDLKLCSLPSNIYRIFSFIGLVKLFRIFENSEEAIQDFDKTA